MSTGAHKIGPQLLPVMQYRDLGRAIGWLTSAFGFQEHETVRGANGQVLYAVMRFTDALIMLGPVRDADLGSLMKQPDEVGGAETQSCYIIVDDVDAHCAKAKAAGADVVFGLTDYEHGGRGYSCRDPEGHIWTFGTYDPRLQAAPAPRLRMSPPLVAAALAVAVLAAGSSWLVIRSGLIPGMATVSVSELEAERTARKAAEQQAQDAQAAIAREHAGRQVAERQTQLAEDDLGRERASRAEIARQLAAAEGVRGALQQQSQQASEQLDLQHRAVDDVKKQLTAAVDAKDETSRRVQTITEELHRQNRSIDAIKKELSEASGGRKDAERQLQQAKHDLEQARGSIASLEKKLATETDAKIAAGKQAADLKQQLEREQASAAALEKQLREANDAKDEAKRAAELARQKLSELQANKTVEAGAKAEEPTAPSTAPSDVPAPKAAPKRAPARETGANAAPMPALVP